ncbi:Pho80p cyclin [Emydomyces testavorans]|uniref:Pho80p cyclin n=1 Tax=Emydomyces testavorans TaxID=2070801 RepID=A0AAF0DRR1_9EURO|nr:Pho80p cyclin [Emydomyces testavorans]
MISSSPTAAALLCASPTSSPSAAAAAAPSPFYDSRLPPPPPPPPLRSPGAARTRSIQELQVAFRRQTVDAGTQYSRPVTPTERVVSATTNPSSSFHHHASWAPNSNPKTTLPSSSTPCEPATSPSNVQLSGDSPSPESGTRMPSTAAGIKRNTPDTRTVSTSKSGAGSGDSDDRPDGSTPKRARPAKSAVKVLPRRYENADPRDLVVLISSMLMELIRFNDQIPLRDGRLTRFHSRSPPRISVQDYLQRLTTHATLSPPILLSMVYYIDRLCALYPAFTVSSLTVHRFLITAATVASKGLSDSFWTNKTYARVGGISIAELALLELEFLWRVEWRIVPQPEVLVDYYRSLVERCDEYVMEPDVNGGQSNVNNARASRLPEATGHNQTS